MKKLLLMSVILASFTVSAQDVAKFITTVDSVNIYNIMEENAPQREKIKDVSRFTLVGKDSKFYLGMGANVKMVGDFDWGSPITNPNIFAPKDIPMSPDAANKSQTLFSVGQSNIYWNFVALPGTKNQVGLFFDVIFLGTTSKPVIEIHHLYMKYRGFTAGYVVSTFTDLKAEPYSIDFGGPASVALVRHPNIYYTAKFGKHKEWSAQLGIDMPNMASFTNTIHTKEINQRMPDIPFFIQRSWADNKGWIRASAILRYLQYVGGNTGGDILLKREGKVGWGVKLSGKTPICGGLSVNYQGVYGKGIASYIQDFSGEHLDLVPIAKQNHLQAVPVWGAFGSVRYDFGKCAFINFTYSQVRSYAKDFDRSAWGDLYKYGQYLTGNLIFNISSFAQFGVEYLWGRRMNYSGVQAHDNRLMLMLNVSI